MNKFLYFGYYIKNLNVKELFQYLRFASADSGKPMIKLFFSSLSSVFRYNVSLLEYFQFRFYNIEKKNRTQWAGTGFMFEYQTKMNPKNVRGVLENKIIFNEQFKSFIKRDFTTLQKALNDPEEIDRLLKNSSGKLVLKNSHGQAGKEVIVIKCTEYNSEELMKFMSSHNYDLLEEYIIQHPKMMKLSPSGINTIRVITQEINGKIEMLGARLRITINSHVDNLAAGNAAASIDIKTGKVNGPGVFSDIQKRDITIHPVTEISIYGFEIPYWNELIKMVNKAALSVKENRSIGWDVAIAEAGPLLIEGNHNWCKLLWQLPVKKGLKAELEKFI